MIANAKADLTLGVLAIIVVFVALFSVVLLAIVRD